MCRRFVVRQASLLGERGRTRRGFGSGRGGALPVPALV